MNGNKLKWNKMKWNEEKWEEADQSAARYNLIK